MIVFLTILFIILFIGNFATKYFAAAVPFLGAISTPLIIVCVIIGAILAIFIGIKIYTETRRK